jgi:hypothetical protein
MPISEGTWNLKVNPLVRTLFFSYHHQLAHRQAAWAPWIYLPQLVGPRLIDQVDLAPAVRSAT